VLCGERAQALEVYRDARRTLVAEFGVEPASELRSLQARILAGGPGTDPAPTPHDHSAPQQLPATVGHFTGRDAEIKALRELTDSGAGSAGGPVIVVVCGTAGVGKTALALQWAHQVGHDFPDGRLYVDLRGYDDGDRVPAADALAAFLRALGVAGQDIPADAGERAAMYRSLLSGRRVLVVLDNAGDPEHIRPLLAGSDTAVTLVTSRDALAGLVSRNGAQRLEIGLLPHADAVELLRALAADRVDSEPEAAAELAARCCRLPLALRIAAELVASRPDVSLAALVEEMADEPRRLDLLGAGGDVGTAVRSVFSWSCRHLDPAAAQAFRLIGLHPGSDLDAHAAAALIGVDAGPARTLLDELTRAHLIHPVGSDHVGMHDLLRAYARELARSEAGEHRQAAISRLLDHYLRTATAAMDTLYPTEATRRPALPRTEGILAPVDSPDAARRWLDRERATMVDIAAHAADHGHPGHATALAFTVERHLQLGLHLDQATALHGHALRAARAIGDRSAEATALTHLGFVAWLQNRFEAAAELQQQALALFEALGDWHGRSRSLHRLALVERKTGRFPQAIAHATRVLDLCRENENRLGQARALLALGVIERERGRDAPAAGHQHRAVALFEELGDPIGRSAAVKELGIIELNAGRLEPAAEHFRQAERLCVETGNASGQAEAMSQLGMVRLGLGDCVSAAAAQERALAVFRRIADRHGESEALARLARVDMAAGRYLRAVEHGEAALEVARRIGARPLEAAILRDLAEAHAALGEIVAECEHRPRFGRCI
jgi:tetratricopeptide (TPR) repeat protein